jgi:hypothetical protein
MANMNQTKKKIINDLIQPILKKYSVKASLSVDCSSIYLNIKSSKFDFFEQYNRIAGAKYNGNYLFSAVSTNMEINPYHFQSEFEGEILKFLSEAHKALCGASFYDNSDSQSDYFDIAYYYYVKIGKWNKPYILTV